MFNLYTRKMEEAGDDGAADGGQAAEGLMADHIAGKEQGADPAAAALPQHVYEARPDFIPEQFYDAESNTVNLEALAKSQKDFRTLAKTNDANKEVPTDVKEYSFEHPEATQFDDNDPIIATSKEAALKYGLSKEAYAGFMGEIVAKFGEVNGQAELDVQAEKDALGPNHERVVADLSDSIDQMVEIGLFGEADYDAAVEVAKNAPGIKMLNKLFSHYQQRPGIPVNTSVAEGKLSKAELDAMVGTDEYNKNPAYRTKVSKGYEALLGKN